MTANLGEGREREGHYRERALNTSIVCFHAISQSLYIHFLVHEVPKQCSLPPPHMTNIPPCIREGGRARGIPSVKSPPQTKQNALTTTMDLANCQRGGEA